MTFIDTITCEELYTIDFRAEWEAINEELAKEDNNNG